MNCDTSVGEIRTRPSASSPTLYSSRANRIVGDHRLRHAVGPSLQNMGRLPTGYVTQSSGPHPNPSAYEQGTGLWRSALRKGAPAGARAVAASMCRSGPECELHVAESRLCRATGWLRTGYRSHHWWTVSSRLTPAKINCGRHLVARGAGLFRGHRLENPAEQPWLPLLWCPTV